MNILPKKRWHVRTKENIARVRKDEAEAAEKDRQERLRIETADREARISVLKQKSKQLLQEAGIKTPEPTEQPISVTEHINLFADLDHATTSTNKEHDKETKEKQEEYEKKIGYLTYLGQDTNEATKKKNWYDVPPEVSRFSRSSDIKETYDKLVLKDPDGKPKSKEIDVINGEVAWKAKQRLDPLNAFKKYSHKTELPKQSKPEISTNDASVDCNSINTHSEHTHKKKDKHKNKKHKHSKKDNNKEDKVAKLLELRKERLKREQQEKKRTELFLTGLNPTTSKPKEVEVKTVKPKYNSQFNPELARQNYR